MLSPSCSSWALAIGASFTHALDIGVLLFHAHVAEESNVGVLVASQQTGRLLQRILTPLLPAADYPNASGLKYALDQCRQGADARAQDHQPGGAAEIAGR